MSDEHHFAWRHFFFGVGAAVSALWLYSAFRSGPDPAPRRRDRHGRSIDSRRNAIYESLFFLGHHLNLSKNDLGLLCRSPNYNVRMCAQRYLGSLILSNDLLIELIAMCSPIAEPEDRARGVAILNFLTQADYSCKRLVEFGALKVLPRALHSGVPNPTRCDAASAILNLLSQCDASSSERYLAIAAREGLLRHMFEILSDPNCPEMLLNIIIVIAQKYSANNRYQKDMIDLGFMPTIVDVSKRYIVNMVTVRYAMETLVRLCAHFPTSNSEVVTALKDLLHHGVVDLICACVRCDDPGVASWGIGLLHEFASRNIARAELRQTRHLSKWLCINLVTQKYAYTNQLIIRSFWYLAIDDLSFLDNIANNSNNLRRILATFSVEEVETNYWAVALISEIVSKKRTHIWILNSMMIPHIHKYVKEPAGTHSTSMLQCMATIIFCLCSSINVTDMLADHSEVVETIQRLMEFSTEDVLLKTTGAIYNACSYSPRLRHEVVTPSVIDRIFWLLGTATKERVMLNCLKLLGMLMVSGVIPPDQVIKKGVLVVLNKMASMLNDTLHTVLDDPEILSNPHWNFSSNGPSNVYASVLSLIIREYCRLIEWKPPRSMPSSQSATSSGTDSASTPERDEIERKAAESILKVSRQILDICFALVPGFFGLASDFHYDLGRAKESELQYTRAEATPPPLFISRIAQRTLFKRKSASAAIIESPEAGMPAESKREMEEAGVDNRELSYSPSSPTAEISESQDQTWDGVDAQFSREHFTKRIEKESAVLLTQILIHNIVECLAELIQCGSSGFVDFSDLYPQIVELAIVLYEVKPPMRTTATKLMASLDPELMLETQAADVLRHCAEFVREYESLLDESAEDAGREDVADHVMSPCDKASDSGNEEEGQQQQQQDTTNKDATAVLVSSPRRRKQLFLGENPVLTISQVVPEYNDNGLSYLLALYTIDRHSCLGIRNDTVTMADQDKVTVIKGAARKPYWQFSRASFRGAPVHSDTVIAECSDEHRKKYYEATQCVGPMYWLCGDGETVLNPSWRFESVRTTSAIDGRAGGRHEFEVELLTEGLMQIGWSTERCWVEPECGQGIGDDFESLACDGSRQRKWYGMGENNTYGQEWHAHDIICAVLDLDNDRVEFFRNGKSMGVAFGRDDDGVFHGTECGFVGLPKGRQWFPMVSLSTSQAVRLVNRRRDFLDGDTSDSISSSSSNNSSHDDEKEAGLPKLALTRKIIDGLPRMHACFSVQVLSSMQDMLGGGYSKGVCCGYLDLPGYLGRVMLGALRTDLSGESWWFLRIDAEDYDAMLMNNGNGNGGYGQFGGDLRRLLFVLEDKDMSRSVKLSRPLIAQEWYTLCVWKSGSIQLSDTHGEILAQLTIDFDAEDVNGQHLWLLRIHPELAFKVRQLCP